MAEFIKGLFGGIKSAPSPSPAGDDADFADYAGAPDPSPASISPTISASGAGQYAVPTSTSTVVYTRWYRVWERASPRDFYQEAFIIPFLVLVCILHLWGRTTNRRKARSWMKAHAPKLEQEFAVLGFLGKRTPSFDDIQSQGLAKAMESDDFKLPQTLLKEKTASEFLTYATGRQNTAFVDFKIFLYKRYNPMTLLVEYLFSFFFESARPPTERMEASAYMFDGKEKELVPRLGKETTEIKTTQSTYDPFVFAIVNKDLMRNVREERYDLSITSTKDHAKLPVWLTTMSEAAEVTEHMITPELVKALEAAGEDFEFLIITDQPLDKPTKLEETVPKKRITLSIKLPSSSSPDAYSTTLPIFSYYLRLPDFLVSSAHYRPEVQRKIRGTRDAEINKLKKADESEKAEERRLESEKKKKGIRDNRLKGLSAEEQRKALEKERAQNQKKQEKKMSRKA